jgi:hypothetical protein
LLSIFNVYPTSISEWIITAYLILLALIILITLFTERLYTIFPYFQKGFKLAIAVFIMSGFAFGKEFFSWRSYLSLVMLILSILFFVVACFFSDEDKINDIIMSNRKENEENEKSKEKDKNEGDIELSGLQNDKEKEEIKKGPLF